MDSVGDRSSSRKEKAIGHTVTKFVEVYNRNDGDPIGIDQAARRLGADKRRVYDIVKLFEFLGIVEKRGTSQYVWRGFGASLYRVLSQLKDEGIKENIANVPKENLQDEERKERFIPDLNSEMGNYEEEGEESSQPGTSLISNKKEKLARNILKLFLCSDDGDIITIKDLTKALLIDESEDRPTKMKSKERSLYDPINVFLSINLIEKTYSPKTKKAGYRWIGPKPIADSLSSKKRASGVEVSNFNPKRNKTNCSYLEPDATNFTYEPSTSAGSANQSDEILDVEPISTIYPPEYYNPGNGWIMRNQSLQMDLARFEDALRSSQKDFGRK